MPPKHKTIQHLPPSSSPALKTPSPPRASSMHLQSSSSSPDDSDDCAEQRPLISNNTQNSKLRRAPSVFSVIKDNECSVSTWKHDGLRLAQLALPLIASNGAGLFINLISLAYIGRLGQASLSAGLLAMTFFNITGVAVVLGFAGAIDTLGGQAFGGKNYREVGHILQRALVLSTITSAVVCALWTGVEGALLKLGQDPTIAANAAAFLQHLSPALFFCSWFECLKRFLQAQGIVRPALYVSAAGIPAAALLNWVFVGKMQLGLAGAAIALAAVDAAMLIFLTVVAYRMEANKREQGDDDSKTWTGWSKAGALTGWKPFITLALPSCAMVILEWAAYEVSVLLSGLLPRPELQVSVMGLCLNVCSFIYMAPLGLGNAASVRVSNALGAGLFKTARRASHVALTMTFVQQLLVCSLLFLGRYHIPSIFTNDAEVIAACAPIFSIIALQQLGDGLNATFGGVLRGAGRQGVGATLNLVAYWVLGLPLGATLAFGLNWGVAGLWWGLTVTASLLAVAMMVLLAKRVDWEKESQRAAFATSSSSDGVSDGAIV
jgi:MATE family multidrug resistance protein